MLVNLSNQFKLQIPSFQSIQFRLSQNYNSSRSIQQQINLYNPTSLTYTQSCQDMNSNSIRCIQYDQSELKDYIKNYKCQQNFHQQQQKQNTNHLQQILLKKPQTKKFRGFKKFNKSNKLIEIKNKRSVLYVQNIQLPATVKANKNHININKKTNASHVITNNNFNINTQNIIDEKTQRNLNISQFLQKKYIYLRSRISFEDSCNSLRLSNSKKSQIKRIHPQQSTQSSNIVKRSYSLKNNDKSNISSYAQSLQNNSLRKSQPYNTNNDSLISRSRRAVTDRIFTKKIIDKVTEKIGRKIGTVNLNQKRKKQFLQDPVQLSEVINIKAIKIQQNNVQSKLYLRKIIQNRVYTQHYDQSDKYNRQKRII